MKRDRFDQVFGEWKPSDFVIALALVSFLLSCVFAPDFWNR